MVDPKTNFIVSAENRASTVLNKIARDFSGLSGAAATAKSMLSGFGGGLLGGLAGSVTLAGLASAVKSVADLQDQFGKMAQQTGVGVRSLTELNYAAQLSDVSTEELGSGLSRLTSKMADVAQGSAEATQVFDDLGVKVRNSDGTLRSSEDVLKDIAQRFSEFEDGATKTAFAIEIFGRSGAKLIPLLNSGRDGLQAAADEAERLGVVFDEKAAKAAESFNDNLTRLQMSAQGLKIELLQGLIPSLDEVISRFVDAQREGLGFVESLNAAKGIKLPGADFSIDGDIELVGKKLKELRAEMEGGRLPSGRGFSDEYRSELAEQIKEVEAHLARLEAARYRIMRRDVEPESGAEHSYYYGGDVAQTKPAPRLTKKTTKGSKADDPLDVLIDAAQLRDKDRLESLKQREDFEEFLGKVLVDSSVKTKDEADAWRSLIDPMAKYREQLEEVERLRKEPGGLTEDEAARARMHVGDQIDQLLVLKQVVSEADEFTLEAARSIQRTLGDGLYDVLSGKFDGIGHRFKDMLARMAADAAAANLSRELFGDFAKTGSIGGLIGQGLSLLSGAGASTGGGNAGLGTAIVPGMTSADDWMLAGLSGSHAGGLDYVPYDGYIAELHKGERVQTAAEARRGSGGLTIQQSFTFHGDANRAEGFALAQRVKAETMAAWREAKQRGDDAVLGG